MIHSTRVHRRTAFVLAAAFALAACDQKLPSTETTLSPVNAALDANAGAWHMIVLSGPTQIAVAAPASVGAAEYQAELAAVKSAQAALTDDQRKIVEYWSGGSVLRWNQILRELVARFNLPPAPREDGTYPAPSAANPFADPQFPFSNPPYAARAYSYVTVAQYEALKVAWYYKFQYKRPSPAKADNGVKALVPATDLPGYPSEDAVMASVSAAVMKLQFPAAVEEIDAKAAEAQNAAIWSGKATASDIAAGVEIGKAVAAVLTARAASDGMKNAVGNKAQWDAFAANATAKGEAPWISMETPPRPPMLPFFGQVKAWAMTPADIVAERPAPPPSTSSQQMKQDLAEVRSYSDNITREQVAIAQKWSDGAGTYTPPGHWNDIAAEYVHDASFSEVRAARAFALLNMAVMDAAVGCWEAKYYYFNPRPTTLDPNAKTAIGLPNFPSYTSGHSTFSGAAATVLGYLFPSGATQFNAMADEAGLSRLYASIHYRSDIDAGKEHGKRIAGYTVRLAKSDGAD